jgi:phosphate transport system substrate-binding protein
MYRRELITGVATGFFLSKAGLANTFVPLTGAGATFPAPLYQRWAQDYKTQTGINVNYQSIGSGGGINQIRARTVHFGATDAPLADPGEMLQFPTVEGQVVLAFNVPGVRQLKLTIDLVSKIYRGEVTRWNHSSIVALNPGARLPNLPISVFYRADGSGTTFVWTSALRNAGVWDSVGTSISWPTGMGARGNEGVTNSVHRVPGAVGYVEYAFARINNLAIAELDREVRAKTFILVHKTGVDRAVNDSIYKYFEWCFNHGLDTARRLHYKPLTTEEYASILGELKSL